MPRDLTEREIKIYSHFTLLLDDSAKQTLVQQLESIKIKREDPSHTTFGVLPSGFPHFDISVFDTYLDASFIDEDREVVSVIAHFVEPGHLSWIERFRTDDRQILEMWPFPEQLHPKAHRRL